MFRIHAQGVVMDATNQWPNDAHLRSIEHDQRVTLPRDGREQRTRAVVAAIGISHRQRGRAAHQGAQCKRETLEQRAA